MRQKETSPSDSPASTQRSPTDHIDVAYTARLTRLALDENEIRTFETQLDSILKYFEKIRRLDVADVEPTAHAIPIENILRADEPVADALEQRIVADNAPQWRNGTFLVPRIIE